jgi:hypothetical protein
MHREVIAEFEREGLTCVTLVSSKNGHKAVTPISPEAFREFIAKKKLYLSDVQYDGGTTIYHYTFKS